MNFSFKITNAQNVPGTKIIGLENTSIKLQNLIHSHLPSLG